MDVQKILDSVKTMSLGEVYAFAIERERDAQAFYKMAKSLVSSPGALTMLEELYQEEVLHERIITEAKRTGKVEFVGLPRGFADMGMADFIPQVTIRSSSSPQDVLLAAIKKEAFAESFYKAALDNTTDPKARELFAHLEVEERNHKNMLQTWYDDHILTNN